MKRCRYTVRVHSLNLEANVLSSGTSTSTSSPCFTSQRDCEISGKIWGKGGGGESGPWVPGAQSSVCRLPVGSSGAVGALGARRP